MEEFVSAHDVRVVAEKLIGRHQLQLGLLRDVSVLYLFKKGSPKEGEEPTHDTIGRAIKSPALWRSITAHDFVIWIAEWWWERASEHAQEALVLHELTHCEVTEEGKLAIGKHDLEEFTLVARHYGPWQEDVQLFDKTLQLWKDEQLEATAPAKTNGGRRRKPEQPGAPA